MRPSTVIVFFVLLGLSVISSCVVATRLKNVEHLQEETAKLNDQLGKLRGELRTVVASDAASAANSGNASLPGTEGLDLQTTADVEARIKKIGDTPTAHELAVCLNEVDGWVVQPDHEEAVLNLKQQLASRLRQQVTKEVIDVQKVCLNAPTGNEAIKRHAEAGQLLSLYPMADDPVTVNGAKALAEQQVDIATRIEVLRRQRYNQWACKQIEAAINGYNNGSSYWSPKKENPLLMKSLVESLGEVDPAQLEPAVMELYNYSSSKF